MTRFFQYRLDHIIFWTLTVFFHGYTRLSLLEKAGAEQFILELLVRNILLAGVIYFAILRIIPRLVSGKKVAASFVLLLLALVFYVLLKNAHDAYLYSVTGEIKRDGFFRHSLYNFSIVLFYLAFASAMHLSKQWYLQREHIRKIELEKLNTELEYLRAQINPHFLFNSINTIYFQIDKQNTSARETLEKFSEMLRYQLYECTGATIAIEKEIQYLYNYVALQKLRLGNRHAIELKTDETLKGSFIPPLLLIPFVENTFKHVSHFTNKPNEICISLVKSGDMLLFTARNTTDVTLKVEPGGIGLKNVIRRLDLLYGDRYTLTTNPQPEVFIVTLQMPFVCN